MRQHVNPLSDIYKKIEPIPSLSEIFKDSEKPLHIDIGCGSGSFLIDLALEQKNWNYLGIEIRKQLVINAKVKSNKEKIDNLFFAFGNADIIFDCFLNKFPMNCLFSVSFNFPDPWFKKKHHKRRVIQPALIDKISKMMVSGGFIFIKSDVQELFEHMEFTLNQSKNFVKSNYQNNMIFNTYNPNNLCTNREIYVIKKKLTIYQSIFQKI
tara:strand:+ start:271 stop:900 length:630 start_codon:yes stop_codon:yes gene_type:complete